MTIDTHSVVYFINEEYGVVIRANGATKEVAAWDGKRKCFGRRMDLLTASFLARTDRYAGKWCAAHPTYSRATAEKAAAALTANLPATDGMVRRCSSVRTTANKISVKLEQDKLESVSDIRIHRLRRIAKMRTRSERRVDARSICSCRGKMSCALWRSSERARSGKK